MVCSASVALGETVAMAASCADALMRDSARTFVKGVARTEGSLNAAPSCGRQPCLWIAAWRERMQSLSAKRELLISALSFTFCPLKKRVSRERSVPAQSTRSRRPNALRSWRMEMRQTAWEREEDEFTVVASVALRLAASPMTRNRSSALPTTASSQSCGRKQPSSSSRSRISVFCSVRRSSALRPANSKYVRETCAPSPSRKKSSSAAKRSICRMV
mmetsp:Transcript_46132/g.133691  ORF Transcript_46132/g.133691 Transcript_46132/m.133691 type:complete len:217 (+) Transcript_46132:181-831(+)